MRIEIGPRELKKNSIVLVRRDTFVKEVFPRVNILSSINILLGSIQESLYSRALERQSSNIIEVSNWEAFVENIDAGKFVRAYWDGTLETEQIIKEKTKATIRCIPFNHENNSEGSCVFSGKPAKHKVIFARSY